MVHPCASNGRQLSNLGYNFFFFFFKLECGELKWSAERDYRVIHFGKSQLTYSIPESMLRLNKFLKNCPKNGENEGKGGRF